ncbi:DNA-binding response regulator [Methylobacterium fujisawaense]
MIEPLRKRVLTDDGPGEPYTRRPETIAQLEELVLLPRDVLFTRCELPRNNPDYVSTECLLYFVRKTRADNSDRSFDCLYRLLLKRVLRSLPKAEHPGDKSEFYGAAAIRDDVAFRFKMLVVEDHHAYSEKLDYFEVRFESALCRLRKTAEKKGWREEKRTTSLAYDDESGELSDEVEKAAGHYDPFDVAKNATTDYRLRLDAAIDQLPVEQTRIIEMLRLKIPIDSKETFAVTIARTLGKGEQTIRQHRDRAYTTIRRILKDGGDL